MEKGFVYCTNKKQFNIADAICKNLMNGLLSCWGVLYQPVLVPHEGKFPVGINDNKITKDCDFENFIKGWYGDTQGLKYV